MTLFRWLASLAIHLAALREPDFGRKRAALQDLVEQAHRLRNFYCLAGIELISRRIVLNLHGSRDAARTDPEVRCLLLRMEGWRSVQLAGEALPVGHSAAKVGDSGREGFDAYWKAFQVSKTV